MKIRYHFAAVATLAFILLLGLAQTGNAQIVLTAENTFGPLVGQDALITQWVGTSSSDFQSLAGMTGANQTWDFTGAVYGDPISLATRYHEPPFDEFPSGSRPEFAEANFAQELLGIVSGSADSVLAFSYFLLTSESILNFGLSAAVDIDDPPDGVLENFAIMLTPPALQMPFPATFGDTWQSVSTQTIAVGGEAGSPFGTVTNTSDVVGWGMLVTPAGSASALMIRETSRQDLFGFVTEFTSIQFLAPLAASGKTSALFALSVLLDLDSNGMVMEASYSTIDAEGGGDPVATEEQGELPSTMTLEPNYPNPFNPGTVVPFSVEQSSHVTLSVHDVLGRQVDIIFDGVVAAGSHQVAWDATGHPSGLYQVVLHSGGEVKTRLVTLQK